MAKAVPEWEHVEKTVKKLTDSDYRDHLKVVFNERDQKLHVFGVKGVDPTNQNWHETMMTGSFMSTYDLAREKWSLVDLPPLDTDPHHREHLFSVGGHVLLFVYSAEGCYHKLFELLGNKFGPEISIEAQCPEKKPECESSRRVAYNFYATADGFYVVSEGASPVTAISRFTVQVDQASGQIKGAKCVCVATLQLDKFYPAGGHVTALAYSDDHKRLFVWGGQQGCGFHWDPSQVLVGDLNPEKPVEISSQQPVQGDRPHYAFSGPSRLVQTPNRLLMLGGCTQIGLCELKQNPDVYAFDCKDVAYKKLAFKMPEETGCQRMSHSFDYKNGVIYLLDAEKGIYRLKLLKE